MSNNEKKNPLLFFLQESWLLLVASVVFGCLLACLNTAWGPEIEKRQKEKFDQLAGGLLTEAKSFEQITTFENTPIMKGVNAEGKLVGWAFVIEGFGFADKIKLVVAVDGPFEKIAGFGVLSSNETPGFGDQINIKDGFYQSQYKGAPVTELTLSKTGDDKVIDSEIVAISGATVTSEAVVKIFNSYLLPVKEKLQSEQLLGQ